MVKPSGAGALLSTKEKTADLISSSEKGLSSQERFSRKDICLTSWKTKQRGADFWNTTLCRRNNLVFYHFLILTGCSIDKKSGDVVFSLKAISKRVEKLGVAIPKAQPSSIILDFLC